MNKSKNCLQAESFDIVAIKDPKMKPFLNVFHATGQNVQQQKLGKLFGIIQVDDISENSAYLPNMLTQIIKKEYFKNKNNNCGKSFEIALHKINLALTELTRHEVIEWMNNLNAAIGIVCGNEIHFTQIGRGRILFLKNKKISTIGNNPNKTEDYHPMKTFSSISAGKIGPNNKLIFTLSDIFETLKEEEIERHLKTFNSSEFDNIISSTLRNEASNTGMVVINIKKQENIETESIVESDLNPEIIETDLNFFGETKIKKKKGLPEKKIVSREKECQEESIKIEDPDKSPFENEPEIFFREKDELALPKLEEEKKEKIKTLQKESSRFLEKIKFFIKNKISTENFSLDKTLFEKISKNIPKIMKVIKKFHQKKIIKSRDQLITLIQKINLEKIKGIYFKLKEKFRLWKNLIILLIKNKNTQKIINEIDVEDNFETEKITTPDSKTTNKKIDKTKNFYLATRNKILELFKNEFAKKILIVIFILITLMISIFLVIKNKKIKFQEFNTINENQKQTPDNKEKVSNIQNLKNLINLEKQIKDSTLFRNDLFFLTENKTLIKFSVRDNTKTEIILPSELKNPEYLSSMESLQLIFITSQGQTYSYSPVTNSFSKNTIVMPDNFKGIGVGTYLTYLYLLDRTSNQIYRYPRAPGGFGIYKEWLKENVDFQNAIEIDISDSIYVAFADGKIKKYFQGKRETEFNLEKDFIPNKIRTKINQNEVFALDKKQGKIIRLFENNNQQDSFQNDQFKDSKDFYVDFENNKIFIITEKKELLMFTYQ